MYGYQEDKNFLACNYLPTWLTYTKYSMRHYYITTINPNFRHVMEWIHRRDVQYELHLARVRFWVPEGVILTEFLLQFADSCSLVDPELDLATGQPLTRH